MKIIFFGDIVGQPGREAIKKILPRWKKKYQPDFVIANGENTAHGLGITQKTFQELLDTGIDLITLGDHTWDQKEAKILLSNKDIPLIRPANFPINNPGRGYRLIELGITKIMVINLIGRVFMKKDYQDPFQVADQILEEQDKQTKIIIVDFHAEATSEKICLGWYLDGRVSALLGTHTHIPTADERILPQGTAYISDVGMVGVKDSSLGADKETLIKAFLNQMPHEFKVAQGAVEVNAVLLEINKQGRAKKIKRIKEIVL